MIVNKGFPKKENHFSLLALAVTTTACLVSSAFVFFGILILTPFVTVIEFYLGPELTFWVNSVFSNLLTGMFVYSLLCIILYFVLRPNIPNEKIVYFFGGYILSGILSGFIGGFVYGFYSLSLEEPVLSLVGINCGIGFIIGTIAGIGVLLTHIYIYKDKLSLTSIILQALVINNTLWGISYTLNFIFSRFLPQLLSHAMTLGGLIFTLGISYLLLFIINRRLEF